MSSKVLETMADRVTLCEQIWEQRVKAQRKEAVGCEAPQPSGGLAALKAWARIPKKAREALKRCNPEAVEALELPISDFLDRVCYTLLQGLFRLLDACVCSPACTACIWRGQELPRLSGAAQPRRRHTGATAAWLKYSWACTGAGG